MAQLLRLEPKTVCKMQPSPGAEVSQCIQEAKDWAKMLKGNVEFQHNSTIYRVDNEGGCIKVS